MKSSNSSHVGKRLESYRSKRSAGRTPEPFGSASTARPRLFVVQKHAATRLHYDFRIELNGVLVSWAVPKGPSWDPNEKRLAVHVEDHPVEYADFEGVIPENNYGAGQVIVWDKGRWTALEDPDEGLKKGKLLFELFGFKMRGVWTLVRTKSKGSAPGRDWLLIKHKDQYASATAQFSEQSVLSGLPLDEVGRGRARADALRAELETLGVPRKPVRLADVEPMLASDREQPFSRPGWIFELKYDGFRLLAAREEGRGALKYRRGLDSTATFPDLTRALALLPCESAILDGEVVVVDEQSRPSFHRLQQRTQLSRAVDIERASIELPAILYVFDLIAFEDFDLRGLPLIERKRLLQKLVPPVGPLRYADHIEERGEAMLEEVRKLGLEGIVGKRGDSHYHGGRSNDWVKVRIQRGGDFVVVGYSPAKRGRMAAGSLHLAARDGDHLVYVSAVRNGLRDKPFTETIEVLNETKRKKPPFEGEGPPGGGHVWCEPQLVCEVRFKQWTSDRKLREPVFVRFRDDKTPDEIDEAPPVEAGVVEHGDEPETPVAQNAPLDAGAQVTQNAPLASTASATAPAQERTINFSNLKKVFWPDEGYTKGDLIDYYRAISPWLLHYLRDRPVVMTRFPDGINGKSFFQKDAPSWSPPWLRTERMWSDQATREIDYFICDDEESLLYVINLGTIPLHVWASRVHTLERPDWCILDLDPKGAPFQNVVEVALTAGKLCKEIGLPAYIKTSGQAGLHILVPLGRQCTFEQGRTVAELLSRVIVARAPAISTMERVISARGGKVYLDWLQNGHGRLIAAPFCARPAPGAPVSTPLDWSEVEPELDPKRFTIKTVPARMKKLKADPMAPVVDEEPNLPAALARLAERMK